jgi:glycosyltransferase involved in cell wall biosynthesis
MRPRVAFTLIGGKNWTGGYNYLLNLLQVLASEVPGAITPVLFAGNDVPQTELAPFAAIHGCELVQDPAFNEAMRTKAILRGLLLGRDEAVIRCFQKARVGIAFESAMYLGWRLPLPAIAWIPDLQHRFLPQLFSKTAWWRREIGFRAQIASGRTIMSSSEDTLEECQRIYPSTRGRIRAVRFAIPAPPPISQETAKAVAFRHGLPEQYFFMPNQFWKHKNHRLVVEALGMLRDQGETIHVVATGRQMDPRDPAHVPNLLAEVKVRGLEGQFITPGLLPYEDVMPLMQASVALLNPSLFEGWSTTVEEARSAGVPMLLSDLAVHKEQASDNATYFDRHNAASLAKAISSFPSLNAADRKNRSALAAANSANRVRIFAAEFVDLVNQALARLAKS